MGLATTQLFCFSSSINPVCPCPVLFLIADDLRPQLNKAYGKTFMHTPNIDAFTDTALVFDW